jgi:hypothetical protein
MHQRRRATGRPRIRWMKGIQDEEVERKVEEGHILG